MAKNDDDLAGKHVLLLDKQFAGHVEGPSGGTVKGVVSDTDDKGKRVRKHLTGNTIEPLTLTVNSTMSPLFWQLLEDATRGKSIPRDISLAATTYYLEPPEIRNFIDTHITNIKFPPMDRNKKERGYFTIEFDPKVIRYERSDHAIIKGDERVSSKKWLCSNFKFEAGDLPCTRVAKIDSFEWELSEAVDEKSNTGKVETRTSEVSNLKLSIDAQDYEPWFDWFELFVLNKKNSEHEERKGSLTFLSDDLTDELFTISFGHMGIISLEQAAVDEGAEEKVARFEVELYVEHMHLDTYD